MQVRAATLFTSLFVSGLNIISFIVPKVLIFINFGVRFKHIS